MNTSFKMNYNKEINATGNKSCTKLHDRRWYRF